MTVDLPDNASAAAAALTVASAGKSSIETTVLLTADEGDAATKLSPVFRAPGA